MLSFNKDKNRNGIEVAFFISRLPDVQEQEMAVERGRCRKGMIPEIILLGHGMNNDMTVIEGWSAILDTNCMCI